MTMTTIMATTFLYKQIQQWSIPMVLNSLKRKSPIATCILTFIHEKKKNNKIKIFNRRILTKV